MGRSKPSLRSKAAHLVSDFTTVILNPISDEPAPPRKNEQGRKSSEDPDVDNESTVPAGPDTSSFSAFLVSLLTSSESGSHPNEESNEPNDQMEDVVASTPETITSVGRKSLFARGKQSLGKAINKAARLSGYRYNRSEQKMDTDINGTGPAEQELVPINATKEPASQFQLPDTSEPSLLLSESMRSVLYISLPVQVKGRKWLLLYSTWRHGISLSTLYRRSMLCPGYSLLVVGDQKGAVFGGLVEAPLRSSTKKKYQGTNNSFVFTSLPSSSIIFRSTGANRYFTLCSPDFLALGGGSHFALYLDGDLLSGSSSTSETFGNTCLAHTPEFNVKEVELWGFVYASQYEEMLELCRMEAPGICRW